VRYTAESLVTECDDTHTHNSDLSEKIYVPLYEGWNFNSGNYLFTTDTK